MSFALSKGNSFSVWDLVKNQEVCRLKIGSGVPPSRSVSPLFSPDGRRVALVSNATTPEEESQIVIHDAQTGEALNVIRVDKLDSTFPASIVNLDFRPDGKQIAALIGNPWPVQNQGPMQLVAWDTAIGTQVFSIATGRQLLAFSHRITGFGRDEEVSFSPDGNQLVAAFSASSSKPIQVWDATPLPEKPCA